jgi:hypothetical protein
VIQQDYFYVGAPEHRLRQELLSDHFHYFGQLAASAVFRLDRPIPPRLYEVDPIAELSLAEELRLFDQAAARTRFRQSKAAVRVSAAAYVRRRHGIDAALEIRREIERDFPEELRLILKHSQAASRMWKRLASP